MAQTTIFRGTARNIYGEPGALEFWYHKTCIVQQTPKGVRLHSGGWRTATTMTAMNQAAHQFGLGFSVFQKNYEWFVSWGDEIIPFEDGMYLKEQA